MGHPLIESVKRAISDLSGVDLDTMGAEFFERAIGVRARALQMTPAQYLQIALGSEAELYLLVQKFLVSESWLMRDCGGLFETLRQCARTRETVRILSAPCANGEEVLTALYLALEAGFHLSNIQIVGVDLSHEAISIAKTFALRNYAFRQGGKEILGALFVPGGDENCHIVRKEFQAAIRYVHGNLLDVDILSGEGKFDLILCRNLIIYFRPSARLKLIDRLHSLLSYEGRLITTAVEAPLFPSEGWHKEPDSPCIFRRGAASGVSAHRRRQPSPRIAGAPVARIPDPAMQISLISSVRPMENSGEPCLRPLKCAALNERQREGAGFARVLKAEENDLLSYVALLERHEVEPDNQEIIFLLGLRSSQSGERIGATYWFSQITEDSPLRQDAELFLWQLDREDNYG